MFPVFEVSLLGVLRLFLELLPFLSLLFLPALHCFF